MEYTVSASEWRNIFAVPVQVVDKYIRTCGALSLRALLILLRRGGSAQEEEIAAELATDAAEVRDALRYWVNEGILTASGRARLQQAAPVQSHGDGSGGGPA